MEKQVPHRAYCPIRNDIGFCFQPLVFPSFPSPQRPKLASSLALNDKAYLIIHPFPANPPLAPLRRSSAAKVELRSTGQPGAAVPT